MKPNERLQAVHILIELLHEKTPLTHLMAAKPDITPFTKTLCFGVCRHYFRLQVMADTLMNKRPKSLDIWVCLLMGLYQLHYLEMADYAVVQETVSLLPQLKAVWAKGLVNAVLRRYCREKETLLKTLEAHAVFQHGHPGWLIKRLKKEWPTDWEAITSANDARAPMSLRINARRTTQADYLNRLTEANIKAHALLISKQGIGLDAPADVTTLPGFNEGLLSVQDEAAQLAVTLLDLAPGLRVLDACAAPGGKTCHILESQKNLKECVALDVDPRRVKRITDNLKRLLLEATVKVGDALYPETWWDGTPFNRILLDAPCSATGVVRRHPDIKVLRTAEDIQAIAALQGQLLRALWPLLSPGGILVYATCSIMLIENTNQIGAFIASHSDAKVIPIPLSIGHALPHGVQILPGENGMDGFFYSVLRKGL